MEKKIERIENIIFKYVEGVRKDIDREVAATNNVNMWFSPLISEINKEKATLIIWLDNDINSLQFENMSSDLRKRANEQFGHFRNEKFEIR